MHNIRSKRPVCTSRHLRICNYFYVNDLALQDKLAIEEKLEEEKRLTHEYADEVAHWANIAGTLSEEVAQQKKQVEIFDRRNRDLMDILRKHNLHYALPDYHRDQI